MTNDGRYTYGDAADAERALLRVRDSLTTNTDDFTAAYVDQIGSVVDNVRRVLDEIDDALLRSGS